MSHLYAVLMGAALMLAGGALVRMDTSAYVTATAAALMFGLLARHVRRTSDGAVKVHGEEMKR